MTQEQIRQEVVVTEAGKEGVFAMIFVLRDNTVQTENVDLSQPIGEVLDNVIQKHGQGIKRLEFVNL